MKLCQPDPTEYLWYLNIIKKQQGKQNDYWNKYALCGIQTLLLLSCDLELFIKHDFWQHRLSLRVDFVPESL